MSSGAYYPSFFEISLCLDSKENLTLGGDGEIFPNLTDNGFSTFFHEYVHYLQNITSFSGVYNLKNTFLMLYDSIDKIRNSGKNRIKIPCLTFYDERYGHFEGNDGEEEEIKDFEILNVSINKTESSPEVNIGENLFYEDVTIDYRAEIDFDCVEDYFQLGEYQISESMAYIMERCCFPDSVVGKLLYPYNVVEKLANYLCPQLSDKEDFLLYLVALCDFSMQFSKPGKIMYMVLSDIKDAKFTPKTPEEIYSFRCNNTNSSLDGQSFNISYTDNYIQEATFLKKWLIGKMDDVDVYVRYFETVFNYAIYLRKEKPFFMLDIARNRNIRKQGMLFDIIDEIGTPMINFTYDTKIIETSDIYLPRCFDADNDDGQIQFYLQANQRLYNTLICGETGCGLINVCKNCCANVFDDYVCANEPWKQSLKKEHCPYGFIWSRYLRNVTPVLPEDD